MAKGRNSAVQSQPAVQQLQKTGYLNNDMLRNYFKIAWRSLLKDRQFSLLNIVGLSSGICCALLIWLWVADETSVDKFFPNENRIYEVMETNRANGQQQSTDESSGLVSDLIVMQAPEVEYASSLAPPSEIYPLGRRQNPQSQRPIRGQRLF
jgi:hypothetical protein